MGLPKGSFIAGVDIGMISEAKSAQEAAELSIAAMKAWTVSRKFTEHGKPVVAAIWTVPQWAAALEFALRGEANCQRLAKDRPFAARS